MIKLTRIINYAKPYSSLMRLDKPIGILLLLWPTLWALWLAAHGFPDLKILVLFCAGVLFMRSAGCVINDIADRKFDGHVARTKQRPLVSGAVSIKAALLLFGSLCILGFSLLLFLNRLTQYLAVVALALAVIYPFTKRFTYWPQLILGAAFSWSIPMAFAAVQNTVPFTAWLLFMTAVLWPLAYDTLYAMVDREDDRKLNIKSTALLLENYDRGFIALLQILLLGLLVIIGKLANLNNYYYLSLAIAGGFFIYQQFLIRQRIPADCFKAFLNNNWAGLIIFVGIALN